MIHLYMQLWMAWVCLFSTKSQNVMDRPFTSEDIRIALFEMSPNKSPGPDGFHPIFFQQYWDIIRDGYWQFVLGYLVGIALFVHSTLLMWS